MFMIGLGTETRGSDPPFFAVQGVLKTSVGFSLFKLLLCTDKLINWFNVDCFYLTLDLTKGY